VAVSPSKQLVADENVDPLNKSGSTAENDKKKIMTVK
jgi:hypothetical protein